MLSDLKQFYNNNVDFNQLYYYKLPCVSCHSAVITLYTKI